MGMIFFVYSSLGCNNNNYDNNNLLHMITFDFAMLRIWNWGKLETNTYSTLHYTPYSALHILYITLHDFILLYTLLSHFSHVLHFSTQLYTSLQILYTTLHY